MSAITDNINFLTGVLSDSNLNVTQNTYGLWVSTFENLNVNENGYAFPEFLVEDIVAFPSALTGMVWTSPNDNGNVTKSRFFISSGVKGESYEDTIQIIADITDSHVSGNFPYLFMTGTDFSGKMYRRCEITGTNISRFSNEEILVISGEDWEDTKLLISGNNADFIYGYQDTGYSGYSNEVSTRYKFLYDDSKNSPVKNSFSFDVPSQVEEGSSFKYRVSRKSDPFGSFFPVETNTNGQLLINLENDEASEEVTSSVNYNFSTPKIISFSPKETNRVSKEDSVSHAKIGFDESVTGVELSKVDGFLEINLFATGSYSGIYRVNIAAESSTPLEPINEIGYVMSGYNASGVGSGIINIAINSGVYLRVLQDGTSYNYTDFMTEAEASSRLKEQQEITYTSPSEGGDDPEAEFKNTLMISEDVALLNNNQESPPIKSFLSNFPLPKKIISKDYYTNYLNSGESYIITPAMAYFKSIYGFCGDESVTLGRFLGTEEIRLINTTTLGLRIDKVSFCKGDTALHDYRPVDDDVFVEDGSVTQIPSDGVVKKENYKNKDAWLNAINYFYTKNYVASFTVFPTLAESGYSDFFNGALGKVKSVIGAPAQNLGENSFLSNGGSVPRIFVEREIYTEPYNESQISEFNKSFTSGSEIVRDLKLTTLQNERLYCVQSYGYVPDDQKSFFPSQNYNEKLTFDKFLEHDSLLGYSIKDSIGKLFFNGIDDAMCLRVEYATGLGSTFSYDNYATSVVWTGFTGTAISIVNQDVKNYAYHLYSYANDTGFLTFHKSNVASGQYPSAGPLSNPPLLTKVAVLKFSKKNFENELATEFVDETSFQAVYPSIADSGFALVAPALIRFNIQTYKYELVADVVNQWSILNKNPINDNSYGDKDSAGLLVPRFFEEDSLETKNSRAVLFNFPHGPMTSKNHEGSPVNIADINGLADGIFENNIIIIEESKETLSYESNYVLDFVNNNDLVKQLAPTRSDLISFSDTRRLKVTKIKYNFYTKNLIIIGDAGSRDSKDFNRGWKYELQYKKIREINWKKVIESNTFIKDEIACRFGILPPNYFDFEQKVHFLSMVAFEVNLPLFLDDNNYEFKIVKYEQLAVSTSSVDVIKKTNFIPIQASWSGNAACSRFDIYQKDTGNNLRLLGSEPVLKTSSYVVPDVKQSYIDMGLANFGSLNYSGYYDVVVSGIIPSTAKVLGSLSDEYGFKVGDTSSDLKVSKVSDLNTAITVVPVSGVTYSPMLNFNNPESKNSAFEINQNHNGYYFVTNSATGTLNGITGQAFEAYVANTGSSSCSVSGITLNTNYVAAINGTPSVATSGLQTLGSGSLILSNVNDNDVIYLKNHFSVSGVGLKKFYLINDSAFNISGSYNSINYPFTAGVTSLVESSLTALVTSSALSNVNIQDDYIYSNTGLTNFDHSYLTLSSAVTNLPIYNASRNSLKINNVTTLDPDSFNLVTWDGVNAPIGFLKNYFDGVRIYLKGLEPGNSITSLKDDTEIIITNFLKDTFNTYYFLKDESVGRDLNIKIINGSSTTLIPSQKQDFKLIVTKDANGINFKMARASTNPDVEITETREQLVILKGDSVQEIDLKDAENLLYQNSFVYFVNKSSEDASFKYGVTRTSFSQNQIARIFLNDKRATVEILEQARSHFKFDVGPTTHLSSTINILNLDFCDTEINFPQVSNFIGKETFLICKNRLFPNKINASRLLDPSNLLERPKGFANLGLDSMFLSVYRKNTDDTKLTIDHTPFSVRNNSMGPRLFEEITPSEKITDHFYVNETGLSNFTLRDFYNRKSKYDGKIFFPVEQEVKIESFDEKNSISKLESISLSFDYNPDEDVNGRLDVRETSDAIVLSRESEKGSIAITFSTVLETSQICANFAYDSVIVSSVNKTLAKNRLIIDNGTIFPIYNKDEFFIARKITEDSRSVDKNIYYTISACEIDVDSIIIPDAFGATKIVIKNNSSKPYVVKSLSGVVVTSVLPNSQIKFIYTSDWGVSVDTSTITDSLIVKFSNQGSEIDSEHPLLSIWDTETVNNARFLNKFITPSLEDGVNKYEMVDVDSVSAIVASAALRIYCYGRRFEIQKVSEKIVYIVNTFYLFAPFKEEIIKRNEFYFNESVEPLTVVERQRVDLLEYFTDVNVNSLPSVIFIPIASQLVTYHLPNLHQPVAEGGPSLGSIISGKKIIFVNLVRANSSTPNQIVNYSDASTENLLDINSLLVYQASATAWTKLTLELPVVQTVYPTLKGVEGVGESSDSVTTHGNEIVYLSNFDKFYIEKSSFNSKTYENFYIYNSCGYSIRIKEINKPDLLFHDLAKFSKISVNAESGTFKSKNITIGGLPSLIATTDKEIINKKLRKGTVVKLTTLTSKNEGTIDDPVFVTYKSIKIYGWHGNETPEELDVDNKCALDLKDLKTYAPNDKLFIYGSPRVNEAGLFFDSYDLTLINVSSLGDEKFYIHNATKSILKIFIEKSLFALPTSRTLEISKSGVVYMENHSKGMFYINTKAPNKNYLSKSKINIFVDALPDYAYDNKDYFFKISQDSYLNASVNVGISSIQDNGGSADIYVYDFSNFKNSDNCNLPLGILLNQDSNRKAYLISNNRQLMTQKIDIFNIQKLLIGVLTSGHYIINNNDSDISVTVGSDIFLVNNSAKDVFVKLNSGSNLSPTLFRNTVLVINSSGEIRYLKKAKRRDEFYCVFNPKTTAFLADKDASDNKINRTKDILPIFSDNSREFPQSSYIKLLSKAGQTRLVYLSIRDYYNGIDIPTDSPENVLAYEIGIGHETIYKFLFFDPSESIYTLTGIEDGSTYVVAADTNLFYNLTNIEGNFSPKMEEDPYVKYNGKKYRDGETFIGRAVSNYEIKYPNYVKVAKIIQNLEKSFNKFEGQPEEAVDLATAETKVYEPDQKLIFKEAILSQLRKTLGSVKYWLPTNTSAFWQDSDFQKDIFTIKEVFPSDYKIITSEDKTQYVSFVKCSMEKTNVRKIEKQSFKTLSSALQFKYPVSNPEYLAIGIGDDWEDSQRTALLNSFVNDPSTFLEPNSKTRLGTHEVIDLDLDIFIAIEKLKSMPAVEFEDFSKSEIVKLLNEEEMAEENTIEDPEVEDE